MIAVLGFLSIIVGLVLLILTVIQAVRHNRSYIRHLIGFIVCLMLFLICVSLNSVSDIDEDTETTASTKESVDEDSETTTSTEEAVDEAQTATEETDTEETVIYEDDIFKATSLGFSDSFGVWCFVVKLENKTDQEITVYPSDSSVDDEMVTFTSGVPATMRAGKSFTQSWILNGEPQKNIEFVMTAYDENMNELARTDLITVEK